MVETAQAQLHLTRPLPDYMSSLAKSRATGALVASTDEVRRELIFVNGELRAACSSLEEEKFGLWLVNRDHISDSERALSLLSQDGHDPVPLGTLLVRRGVIDEEVLERELEDLTVAIVRRAAAAARSWCEFREGLRSSPHDTLPSFTTSEAILMAAREFPDNGAKLRSLGSLDQVAWPSSALDALLDGLALTPREAFILSRLDGSKSLNQVLTLGPMPRDETIATLYTLKVAGIVHLGSTPPTAPPQAPLPGRPRREIKLPVQMVDEGSLSEHQRGERAEILDLAEQVTRLDHYRALGLRPGAAPASIHERWETWKRRFSPDRAQEPHLRDLGPQLQAILERAGDAFEVLADSTSRHRYDEILEATGSETNPGLPVGASLHAPDQAAREELAEANYRRAEELERDGEIYLAIRLLEHASVMAPRPAGLLWLSRLLLRNPLWANRSLQAIRKALELDPRNVEGWVELAEFWRRRGSAERQRKALERALAVDPHDERASSMYTRLVGARELERFRKRFRNAAR